MKSLNFSLSLRSNISFVQNPDELATDVAITSDDVQPQAVCRSPILDTRCELTFDSFTKHQKLTGVSKAKNENVLNRSISLQLRGFGSGSYCPVEHELSPSRRQLNLIWHLA